MILVDSNIPMYLVGADHPNKGRAERLVDELIDRGERMVTDAEVLQEILHRYVAIQRLDAVQPAFDALLGIVDDVLAIERVDVEQAKGLVLRHGRRSARDALHLALMSRHGVTQILSFDRGFDGVPGVARLS